MIKIAIADPTDSAEIINLQRLAYQSEAELYNDWSLPPLTQTIDNLIQEFSRSVILKRFQAIASSALLEPELKMIYAKLDD